VLSGRSPNGSSQGRIAIAAMTWAEACMKRLVSLAAALAVTFFAAMPVGATGPASTNIYFHTLAQYQSGQFVPNLENLFYNGGPQGVQIKTQVYVVWWGAEWRSGFSTDGYSSQKAQKYTTDFFNGVGGSKWIGTDNQYCENVPLLTFNCAQYRSARYITNPKSQLKGTWNDLTPVPASPDDADIAAAALRAKTHFGYNKNATYMIYTPTGKSEVGFNLVWCAWHSATKDSAGNIVAYGYIPYQPDARENCGMNFVNATNDSYGHGYFDGLSIVAGHEYEEAKSDANVGYGWTDIGGQENADKCAWDSRSGNITLGRNYYAVQPLWSNKLGDCSMG
jgi:hypothetical protein